MTTDIAAISDTAAGGLRATLDMLLQDMPLEEVDADALPWAQPLLVLRSAHMERMQAFMQQVARRGGAPALHVISHARDEVAIRAMAPSEITFHAYPTPGRYRLEELPPATLDALRDVGFGSLFFLDEGVTGDRLAEAQRLLAAIDENRMVTFRGDGTFARSRDWRRRRLAEAAFVRLIEWYQLRLDPGFPDGPVFPDSLK